MTDKKYRDWEEVPDDLKKTFDRLGVPEAERKYLAGSSAQYESEVVYHNMREDFEKLGIIFTDTDTALRDYPELFKKWFGKLVKPTDNKFAALNAAVWSGGSFIYVPKGVQTKTPIQSYFRLNAENSGQFERTLIIVDEGARVDTWKGVLHLIILLIVYMQRWLKLTLKKMRIVGIRPFKTGRTTFIVWKPSGQLLKKTRRWSGLMVT